jgi:hypothetical protein
MATTAFQSGHLVDILGFKKQFSDTLFYFIQCSLSVDWIILMILKILSTQNFGKYVNVIIYNKFFWVDRIYFKSFK